MTDATTDTDGMALAADGTPLKKRLGQALFRSKMRALGLVTPLLLLIFFCFLVPIIIFLIRGIHNDTFEVNMPSVTVELAQWDAISDPTEAMYT
ncbi:MAG: ABC transporter permease, partial [Amylibacter sp.]